MLRTHTPSLLLSAVLGLGLAAVPVGIDLSGPMLDKSVWAKNGGNGGNGGGNGGNGGGNGGNAGSKGGGRHAEGNNGAKGPQADGPQVGKAETGDAGIGQPGNGEETSVSGVHESDLGRLNGFMHASEQARASAAPNSAVGQVSHGYADALADYAAGQGSLANAGAAFAAAANKTVSPEVVKAVNDELGTLAELGAEEQEAIAEAIAEAANATPPADDGTEAGAPDETDDSVAASADTGEPVMQ